MLNPDQALDGAGILGPVAAMLIEDAHVQLVTRSADGEAAIALAATLARLGADLSALGGAAAVLVQGSDNSR